MIGVAPENFIGTEPGLVPDLPEGPDGQDAPIRARASAPAA